MTPLPSKVVDSPGTSAPPVVAVMVVHEPGAWFDEVLYALAHQDYPNLNLLFIVAGEAGDAPQRIKAQLPGAFVRSVPANPGFGIAANESIRLVEGSGLFCFMHDDVALSPGAISALVEEMYRSNAGIVGAKLVEWATPEVLQHIGYAVDRFGETDPMIEPGELDQEQHDGVRDVFGVSSACLMIRADLFRSLGGFPVGYDYHGEDLDLCWRSHLSGARVLIVPSAVGRHLGGLRGRRRDIGHRRAIARHRIDTVATMAGRWRAPVVLAQLAIVSLVETVVGVFTGRVRDGLASLYALVGLPARLGGVLARRRQIRALRQVPDREVARMQLRGSARLASFLRLRLSRSDRPVLGQVDKRAAISRVTLGVWTVVLAAFLFGSRGPLSRGIDSFGQFLRIPAGGDLLRRYVAGWNPQGFGQAGHPPTAGALLGFADLLPIPRGLTRTLLILGLVVLGYLGSWRLGRFLPSTRARAVGLAAYAAVPLPYAAIAAGRWGVLVGYGAFPWAIDLVRRISGIGVLRAGQSWGDDDIADAVVSVPARARLRLTASLGLVCAVAGAFVPVFPLLVLAAVVLIALGTLLARGSATTLIGAAAAAGAVLIAALLNLPWLATLVRQGGWSDLVGAPGQPDHIGLLHVASFGIGESVLGPASVGLYVALGAAPLIGRGWRLTWAARAIAMSLGFLLLAVLGDRGALPFALPEVGILLVPVACGLSLGTASAVAAFEHDIAGARLGWRQPLGLLVGLGIVVGLVPGLAAAFDGSWSTPRLTLATLLRQLPAADTLGPSGAPIGDYRVLYLGDERLLPIPGRPLYPGVAYAVADDGAISVESNWRAAEGDGDRVLRESLGALAEVSTARVGRLLGSLGIRFVVVPVDDGIVRAGRPTGIPEGVRDALSAQLDLRLKATSDQLVVYENTAWVPVRSSLDAVGAASSLEAGASAIVTGPLGGGVPAFVGSDPSRPASANLAPGTLNLAVDDPDRWLVRSGGATVAGRASFGWSSAFEVPGGQTTLEMRPVSGRRPLLAVQVVLWFGVLALASGGAAAVRRRRPPVGDAPVLDFGSMSAGDPGAEDEAGVGE